MLSKQEAQLIAGLTTDPGFLLLLEKIQAGIDTLTDQLQAANKEKTDEILPYWKALRTIYIELKYAPDDMTKYLDDLKHDVEPLTEDVIAKNQLNTFFNNFNKIRNEHVDRLSEILPQNSDTRWDNNSLGNLL